MALGFQWSMCSAVLLLSVHANPGPRSSQEPNIATVHTSLKTSQSTAPVPQLSCVNDYVKNVTCTWKHPTFHPDLDCWVSGVKITYPTKRNGPPAKYMNSSCKLKQDGDGEFPGCTFAFTVKFNYYEKLPNISLKCKGKLIEAQKNYSPKDHIKLHPPGTPNVSSTSNMTRITWSLGNPPSLKPFQFQAQIKHVDQSWDEVESQPTVVEEMVIWPKLTGNLQVRVRIKIPSSDRYLCQWSEWSPTASWVAEEAGRVSSGLNPAQSTVFIFLISALSLGLSCVSVLILYKCCPQKRRLTYKMLPNPSKYFYTLQSVHGGNLKTWISPRPVSSCFFLPHPCVDLCSVELCESKDVAPSGPPCLPPALVHSLAEFDPFSSCSSSCFSNMDYFMSSSENSSAQTRTRPFFSDQSSVLTSNRRPHLSLSPSILSSSIYESLKQEPQSPDSGFGVGKFEEQENQSSPLLSLALTVSSPVYTSDETLVLHNQGMDEHTGPNEDLGWPVTEPMCRASSLPVDPGKAGYLTLKDLHATFSNRSI
ncbi:unnamed protein product [Knipowitschia caucasica]|uniref:Interleukin-2 receptor subunit beta N-terminal domain-containing protein n=1 Tax=Knipowitschia caucasica TaxID=637954 RepID=A0AAV2KIA5_KNICA